MRKIVLIAGSISLAGCGVIEWPGQYVPRGDNIENLRQMVAYPADLGAGRGAKTERGTPAAQAVDRLNTDKRRPLPQTSFVTFGNGGGGNGGPGNGGQAQ